MEQEKTKAEIYQKKGYLKVEDKDAFQTIDETCMFLGTQAISRGYLKVGVAPISLNEKLEIWFPNESNDKRWENKLNDEEGTFTEYNSDDTKREEHVAACLKDNKVRVTFFKSKTKYNDNQYHFIGVFVLDIAATEEQGKCIWRRISKEYIL